MAAVGRIGGIIGQPSRFAIIGPPDSDSDEENVSHHTLQLKSAVAIGSYRAGTV